MTTSCLVIWTLKDGETPTDMADLFFICRIHQNRLATLDLAVVYNDKTAFVVRAEGLSSSLISALETL